MNKIQVKMDYLINEPQDSHSVMAAEFTTFSVIDRIRRKQTIQCLSKIKQNY